MRKNLHSVFLLHIGITLIFLAFSELLFGQVQVGIPFIQNYTAKDYNADPQNWAIAQDRRGVMYFGNTNGLLEYDGNNWKLYKVKNKSAVRAIAIGEDNRIYIGASGEFGFMKVNNIGKLTYTSLSENLEQITFNTVWKVFYTRNGVYFFAGRKQIYRYDNDSLYEVEIDKNIQRIRGFCIEDEIYAAATNYGVHKVINDTLVQIHDDNSITSKNVYAILPFENGLLLGTRNEGLFKLTYNRSSDSFNITTIETELDNYLKEYNLYYGIDLNNGKYAFATLQGGVVIINEKGEIVNILNRSMGILADDIYYLYLDRNENLWIGQERGISKVEINSAFTQFNSINSLEGSLISGQIYNGHLYLGTSMGIFHLLDFDIEKADNPIVIEPISKKYNYVLDFCSVKDPKSDQEIFLASSLRNIIQIYDRGKTRELIPLYGCYSMVASRNNPDRIFLGHPDGINSIRFDFGKQKKEYQIPYENEGNLFDFKEDIRLLNTDLRGDLWISSAFNGIYYLRFGEDENLDDYELFHYDLEAGLPANDGNRVYNLYDKTVISTHNGLYKISNPSLLESNPSEVRFIPDSAFGLNYRNDSILIYTLATDKENNVWFGTNSGVFKYLHRDGINSELISYPMKRISGVEIESIIIEEEGIPWFATKDALYRYNFNNKSRFFPNYYALIRRVSLYNDSTIFYGNEPDLNDQEKYLGQKVINDQKLHYQQNSIRFEFAVPSYDNEASNQFKYMLEGFDKNWIGWTNETRRDYMNLNMFLQ